MLLKKIFCFGGGKTKSDSEFLSYNQMLNSGIKIRDKKKKYSNSRVVRTKFLNETKNHNPPPCKLNGRSLNGLGWLLVCVVVFSNYSALL